MANTTIIINTWACPNCEYKQYNDPANEQEMKTIFCEPRYVGRPVGACPACYAGENAQRTKQLSMMESISGADLSLLGRKQVADDATLEARQVDEIDSSGQTVMVQTGTEQKLAIVDGKPAVVDVPTYSPKMRSLTTKELSALKLQRDQNLDDLEKVAVKEVS